MNFMLIFGPPAVGKMTVGQEIARRTGYKLFHNHMSIDLVTQVFERGTPQFSVCNDTIRTIFFEQAAESDLPGLIFTYVWAFDEKDDWKFAEKITSIFTKKNCPVYYVELYAHLEERLRRNKSPNRLAHKPSKRDLTFSEQNLLDLDGWQLNSTENHWPEYPYLKVDSTSLTAAQTAETILQHFPLMP